MHITADALADAFRAEKLTPTLVLKKYLERISKLEPQYHAFAKIFAEEALEAAELATSNFRTGIDSGPLQGIPVAVKDLVTTNEGPTGVGTTFLDKYLPRVDATFVGQLREQGAIILGKTTLTEGAFSVHHPSLSTPVNPWSPGHWTGVSSSGSGVALAAGMTPLAIGTDTGGSIRLPSACNRLVGLKPTFGAVDKSGCFPLAPGLDHIGSMARNVAGCRMLYRAMKTPSGDSVERDLTMRIGIDFSLMRSTCDASVNSLMLRVIEDYKRLGFDVVDIPLDYQQRELASAWAKSVAAAVTQVHADYIPKHQADYAAGMRFLMELGPSIDASELQEIEHLAGRFKQQVDSALYGIDALLCPVMPDPVTRVEAMQTRPPDPNAITRSMTYTAPFNYSGHPCLTLPAGFIAGIPVGYQLIGDKYQEEHLFKVAALHEELCDWTSDTPDAT